MAVPIMLVPAERSGSPASAELAQRREMLAGAIAATGLPAGAYERQIAGVSALVFGSSREGAIVVVHFHGGGYRQGQPEMIARYAAALAEIVGIEVCCPAYRLAPEHPFPSALNDALRIIREQALRPGVRLVLAGDSAGGGLATAAAVVCAQEGIALAGLLLHSPWLDLTVSSPWYVQNAERDPLFSGPAALEARDQYLAGHDAGDVLASPLFAEPRLFPATLITVGSGEVLLGDALRLRARLHEAGNDVQLCQIDGMDHVAVTRGMHLTGSDQAFRASVNFLCRL